MQPVQYYMYSIYNITDHARLHYRCYCHHLRIRVLLPPSTYTCAIDTCIQYYTGWVGGILPGTFFNLCSWMHNYNVCQPIEWFHVPQQLQMQEHNGKRTTM